MYFLIVFFVSLYPGRLLDTVGRFLAPLKIIALDWIGGSGTAVSLARRFGGNLALNLGTFGGVYIAGGIVPRFLEFFKASGFRGGFEDKGRFKSYVQDIPVYLIVHDNPGLLGSGAHLRQTLGQYL